MDKWGQRELRTNKLVRLCAGYLVKKEFTPKNVYGLCKLTWISSSYDSKNGSYIKSTKLPALSAIFENDYLNLPYDTIADEITKLTATPLAELKDLIYEGTGYTNFYNAYRKSAEGWIKDNFSIIKTLIHNGYDIRNKSDAESIVDKISKLPRIPKGNGSPGSMAPEYLLTPLLFSLDRRLKFPLINGNEGVTKLLKKLQVNNASLLKKFKAVSALIGNGDVKTAIDIDRLGGDLPAFVSIDGNAPERKLLRKKSPRDLGLKDEEDVHVIRKAVSIHAKRLHNKMTNLLFSTLGNFELHEGNSKENMFDVLAKNINKKNNDLLIEVKASSNIADVRMAVGQLMDYSRQLASHKNTLLAVFVPEKPDIHVVDFLNFHRFYLIWIDGNEIVTNTKALPFKLCKN